MNLENILQSDEQRQDALSSELASRSAFVAALDTLAAILVADWERATSHHAIAFALYIGIAVSFGLLLAVAVGLRYSYAAESSKWSEWLENRKNELQEFGVTEPQERAESELSAAFMQSALGRAHQNRVANKIKAKALTASGSIAILAVLSVIVLEILSTARLF